MTSKILSFATNINDNFISYLAIKCIHKIITTNKRFGVYLRNDKETLINMLSTNHYIQIGNNNNYKSSKTELRSIKLITISI